MLFTDYVEEAIRFHFIGLSYGATGLTVSSDIIYYYSSWNT